MFLKSIEVRGFKSFADKTELDFKKGVTAVIGPNGSGKSNISDAVRWVLGEQSVKSLRGSKMQDVIFAGTQFRKPVGVAQVSLLLDNQDGGLQIDYSQVKVTRRIYRSGESEYLINNSKCRLKDIQELFMDTGIGKEGYSLIGQGKIEAILSGHAEDRRILVEEAAGIVKYKTRKKEAERRLKNTDENLIRINDLISTFEDRIEPLRKDKEKAELFLGLSEGLKELEINVLLDSYERNSQKVIEIEKQLDEFRGQHQELDQNLNDKKTEVNTLQNNYEVFEREYSIEKQKYYDERSRKEKFSGEIKLLEERILNANKMILSQNSELEKSSSKKIKLKKLLDEVEKALVEIDNICNQNKEKKGRLEKASIEYTGKISVLDNKISNTEVQIERIKEELYAKKSNYNVIEKQLHDLKLKKDEMDINIRSLERASKVKDKTVEDFIYKQQELEANIEIYSEEINVLKKEAIEKKSKKKEDEHKLESINRVLNTNTAKVNALKQLEQQYEGYNKSVQRLMKDIQHVNKNHINNSWVLGELINVDKKYEVSIEIALGNAISNVVCENQRIAKDLLHILKSKKLGRATFLPLDNLKVRQLVLNNRIRSMDGFIGIASELIEYDKKFRASIEFVLGRVVIVDNLDNAVEIAKVGNFSFRIVTLDGQVVNPGGSLTGGSVYQKNNSIIGRKAEIGQLVERNSELKVESDRVLMSLKQINQQIQKNDDDVMSLKEKIHEVEIEKMRIDTTIKGIKNEKISLINEIQNKKKILSSYLQEILKVSDEVDGFEEKEAALKRIYETTAKNIDVYMKDREELKEELEAINSGITDLRIYEAEINQKFDNKRSELNRISGELKEVNKSLFELKNAKEKNENDKSNSEDKVQEYTESIKDIECYLIDAEGVFVANEEKKNRTREIIKNLSNEIVKLEEDRGYLSSAVNKYEITFAKVSSEKEVILAKMNDDLNITLAEAEAFKNTDIDIEKASREIKSIKSKISTLGTVNLGAIEEYKEVKEKFDFMSSQREDLLLSKEELLKLIEEMTTKMKILFKENFEIMRKNFNITFKELFKGGSADLILGDGDELQADIEINVQPPGKKLQNISLMSGGEKVLSAIALLFAILKMKPTPFCILDEIEAALDDANVFRFAEFLKKFSDRIQFIVITHRKGTMSMSDMVYGVTMEEKGISKILSLELGKDKIDL